MIIGLSGKACVGKNTVARIIQYLTDKKTADYNYPESEKDFNSWKKNVKRPKWRQKAYADKVKEICSTLTGLPVSAFHERSNKQKTLSELTGDDRWKKYIVIPSLRSKSKPIEVSTRKEAEKAAQTYGLSMDRDKGVQSGHIIEVELTMRQFMQTIGTDCVRNQVHPQAWILALYAEYNSKMVRKSKAGIDGYEDVEEYPDWIVTDCRFPNEADAVKERGGIVWWIDRDVESDDNHFSETSMKNYEFDHTIDNGGDIDLLIATVKHALKKFDIL